MKPSAYVIHTAPGRCRIKIPDKRHDSEYFDALESDLISVTGVKRVTINTITSSVLIQYQEQELPLEDLKSHLDAISHFEMTAEPKTVTIWEDASQRLNRVDDYLKESSGGQIDMRSLMIVVFVLLAIRQLQRGSILGSASNLLWYATHLVLNKK